MRGTTKTRLFALILSLVMTVSLLPISAFAEPMDGGEITMTVGETRDMTLWGMFTEWESEAPEVASFDEQGILHANQSGVTHVTLRAIDPGSGASTEMSYLVTVEEDNSDEIVGSLKLLARYNDAMPFYDGHVYLLFTSYQDDVTITVDDLYGAYRLSEQYYKDIRSDIANGSNHTGSDTEPYFTFDDAANSVTLDRGEIVTIGMYRGFDLSVVDAALGTVKNSTLWTELQKLGTLGKLKAGSIDGVCQLLQSGAISIEDAFTQMMALCGTLRLDMNLLFDGVVEGGVCFNRELYNQKLEWDQYENVTMETEITREQLHKMETALCGNKNRFSILKNSCATVALRAWNAALCSEDDTTYQLTTSGSGIFALMDAPKSVRDAMIDRFSSWDGFYRNSAEGGDPDAGYPDETGWVYVSAPKMVTEYDYADESIQIDRERTHLAAIINAAVEPFPRNVIEQRVEVNMQTSDSGDGAVTVSAIDFTYDDGTTVTVDENTPLEDGIWLKVRYQAPDYNACSVTDAEGHTLPGTFEGGWLRFRAPQLPITFRTVETLNEERIVGRLTVSSRKIYQGQLVAHAALTFTTYEDVELPISYFMYIEPNAQYKALMEDYRDHPENYASDPAIYSEALDIEDRESYFDIHRGAPLADPAALDPVVLRRGESCTMSCYSYEDAVNTVLAAFTGDSSVADNESVQKLLAQLAQYQSSGEVDQLSAAYNLIRTLMTMYVGTLQTGSNPADGRIENGGLLVNRELYNQFVRDDSQLPNNWYSVELTASELRAMVDYLSDSENNYYSLFVKNCATGVIDVWNAALADRPALRLKANYSGLAADPQSLYFELGQLRRKPNLGGTGGTDLYPRTVALAPIPVDGKNIYAYEDSVSIHCFDEDWNEITDQIYVIARDGEEPDWDGACEPEGGFLWFYDLEPYTAYTVYTRLKDAYNSAPSKAVGTGFMTDAAISGVGEPVVGRTLRVVSRPEDLDLTYQWFRTDENDEVETEIEGAVGDSYTVTEDDLGSQLIVRVFMGGEYDRTVGFGFVGYASPVPTLPESASFTDSMTVAITAEEGEIIYYTTNGEDPNLEGVEYNEPFTITETTTVKAIGWLEGNYNSDVVSATYTLAAAGTPTDPASGGGSSGGGSSSSGSGSSGGGSGSGGSSAASPTAQSGAKTSETRNSDGTVTKTTTAPDGTTATVVTDADGALRSADLKLSEQAVSEAVKSKNPIVIPVAVAVPKENSATIRVTVPTAVATGRSVPSVEIAFADEDYGIVAFQKQKDGSLQVIKDSRMGGVVVPVEESCELVIADNSKSFPDVESSRWYAKYVAFVTAREIFGGTAKGFEPDAEMTRAMVAQMLYNFDPNSAPGKTEAFRDVNAGSWYADAVGWASENGIVTGGKGLYRPGDPVTRQELVTILYRYAAFARYRVGGDGTLSGWSDADAVSAYAREAMSWAIESGVIDGIAGALKPRANATRAQVAAIMTRFVQNLTK